MFSQDTTWDEVQERFGGRASVSVARRLGQGQQPNAEPSQRPPPEKMREFGRWWGDLVAKLMHPRDGKDKWFSSSPVVPGIKDRQLPEGTLICNFAGGKAGDPGLLQYDDVVTFFHEFGHLMHNILGGRQPWSGEAGFATETDFVEAPSQMLEEFFRDPTILRSFAKHYQTNEPLPLDLIERMNRASAFGRATWAQGQLFYSNYSLDLHGEIHHRC